MTHGEDMLYFNHGNLLMKKTLAYESHANTNPLTFLAIVWGSVSRHYRGERHALLCEG